MGRRSVARMLKLERSIVSVLARRLRSRADVELENLALRHLWFLKLNPCELVGGFDELERRQDRNYADTHLLRYVRELAESRKRVRGSMLPLIGSRGLPCTE
jgi:hypothetical protein